MGVIKKIITYPGIENPSSIAEINVEICGLKNAIKIAEELISRYEQVFSLMNLKKEVEFYASQEKNASEIKKGEGKQEPKTERKTGSCSQGSEKQSEK